MSDTNKKILLVLAAIGILVLTFVFVIKPKREEIDILEGEVAELQARYDDLCEKEKHKDEFIQETADFNKKFDEVIADYPADLNQETTVMFMKGVEESVDFVNDAFTMPRESSFYVLGEGAVDPNNNLVEASDDEEVPYVCQTDAYAITYNGSYEGLKDYLNYIATYKYRMAISSINIAYASDAEDVLDECTGSVVLNAYSISGPNRTPDKPSVDVKEGKDNIFAAEGSGAAAVSFDSNEGEDIVASHTLVMLLNNSENDTSSGIIVASSEADEKTYVTSSENDVVDVDVNVTSEDDKNYVTYSIGGKEYRTEVTSPNVTIYVKSNSRVGADDKNGVNVNISNDTELGVFIKVVGDDSSSPRFNLKKKSGTVKVY